MLPIQEFKLNKKFENLYLQARSNEGRIMSIKQIKALPYLKEQPLAKEWKQRIQSTDRLLSFIKKQQSQNILDIGCGNAWLLHKIAPMVHQADGIEVNLQELEQAAEVLADYQNVELYYGDIFKIPLKRSYDMIILNAVIQYFPDLRQLLNHLQSCLSPNGSIHILDSPIYSLQKVSKAKARSDSYYQSIGCEDMKNHYFHHTWSALKDSNYQICYNPNTYLARIARKLGYKDSPFPWIKITTSQRLK